MLKRLESQPLQHLKASALEPHNGPLRFQFERLTEIAREIAPLMVLHWQGLPPSHKRIPLDVDWGRALMADAQGLVHLLTVRDGQQLVGYIIDHVINPIMCTNTKWCFVEAIYLLPEYREGWTGYKLIKKNDESMEKLGVKVIKFFLPVNSFEPLLKRLKYEFIEHAAFKFIGD